MYEVILYTKNIDRMLEIKKFYLKSERRGRLKDDNLST
jgi:hypothetical protein